MRLLASFTLLVGLFSCGQVNNSRELASTECATSKMETCINNTLVIGGNTADPIIWRGGSAGGPMMMLSIRI